MRMMRTTTPTAEKVPATAAVFWKNGLEPLLLDDSVGSGPVEVKVRTTVSVEVLPSEVKTCKEVDGTRDVIVGRVLLLVGLEEDEGMIEEGGGEDEEEVEEAEEVELELDSVEELDEEELEELEELLDSVDEDWLELEELELLEELSTRVLDSEDVDEELEVGGSGGAVVVGVSVGADVGVDAGVEVGRGSDNEVGRDMV